MSSSSVSLVKISRSIGNPWKPNASRAMRGPPRPVLKKIPDGVKQGTMATRIYRAKGKESRPISIEISYSRQ
jgi:hypothetical protein